VETALKAIDFAAENDISIDSEFSANLRQSINFNRNRYYSPALGRFTSKDPIGFNGDINLYRYAANDPIYFTDPWGYRPYGTGDVAGVRIGEEFGPSGAGYSFGKGLSLGGLLSSLFDFPMVCNPSNPANQVFNNMGASGGDKGGSSGGNNRNIDPQNGSNSGDPGNDWKPLKGKDADKAANDLGFKQKIPSQKTPFDSHGQPAYRKGNKYITPDTDGHHGGAWKMFDGKGNRLGTFDINLNKIGK
jgi:RHS repeat-associated protein